MLGYSVARMIILGRKCCTLLLSLYTVGNKVFLSYTVMHEQCDFPASGANPRIWTCGTRLLLLVWAGWGLGMRLIHNLANCPTHSNTQVMNNASMNNGYIVQSQNTSVKIHLRLCQPHSQALVCRQGAWERDYSYAWSVCWCKHTEHLIWKYSVILLQS